LRRENSGAIIEVMAKPKSKAGQRFAQHLDGLDTLAASFGLRAVFDAKPNLPTYLIDARSGKRIHGPFKSLSAAEAKLNLLHMKKNQSS
jgi:hypothetical protein